MQSHLSGLREAVCDRALELGRQRQHRAEYFADWSEVVVRDPATEAKKFFIKNGSGIEYADDFLGRDGGLAVVQFDDNARHTLLAKGHQHASAHNWRVFRGDTISKGHVQWNREGNV